MTAPGFPRCRDYPNWNRFAMEYLPILSNHKIQQILLLTIYTGA